MSPVLVVPIGSVCEDFLSRLSKKINEVFRVPTLRNNLLFDPALAFNSYRYQYHSTMLLSLLLTNYSEAGGKILGVTNYDLFVPVLTFVFGEAQLNGKAAVVSSFRMRPEYYGLQEDEELVKSRFEKEAIHEIGHTFGLIHCSNGLCAMHSSTYAEDIDLKSDRLCPECLLQLFPASLSIP